MGKLLMWVAIGLAAWFAWRLFVISKRRSERSAAEPDAEASGRRASEQDPSPDAQRMGGPERMVQCALCGLHLPASEGRFASGKVYCSDAHRDQAAASDVDPHKATSDGRSDHG